MHAVMIVSVVFGGIVLSLGIICGTILLGIRARHGGISRNSREQAREEARMIQEIYHGMSMLEDRIDALETILMDRDKKERNRQ